MPYIYDDAGGGGTNVDTTARAAINTAGPWAGVAPTNAKLGLDPATGNEYYVDGAGNWQPVVGGAPSGLNQTGPWTGAAGANDIYGVDPATGDRYYVDAAGNWQPVVDGEPSGLNNVGPWTGAAGADDKIGYNPATGDEYYVDNAGNWQPAIDERGLVAPTQSIDQTGTLAPPVAPYHTQPYVVDSSGTPDGNDPALPAGNQDFVTIPLSPATAVGQWISVSRNGPNTILMQGTVDSDATGAYHNKDKHTVYLYSQDGTTWTYFRNE